MNKDFLEVRLDVYGWNLEREVHGAPVPHHPSAERVVTRANSLCLRCIDAPRTRGVLNSQYIFHINSLDNCIESRRNLQLPITPGTQGIRPALFYYADLRHLTILTLLL